MKISSQKYRKQRFHAKKTLKRRIKGLKKGKYIVSVRAYRKSGKKTKYGPWSDGRLVIVK